MQIVRWYVHEHCYTDVEGRGRVSWLNEATVWRVILRRPRPTTNEVRQPLVRGRLMGCEVRTALCYVDLGPGISLYK